MSTQPILLNKQVDEITFLKKGETFVYRSPITKSRTTGIIDRFVLIPVLDRENGTVSLRFQIVSTNNIYYDVDQSISFTYRQHTGDTLDKFRQFMDIFKQVHMKHTQHLKDWVAKNPNNSTK